MITHSGIEANPEKVQAILNMALPKTPHEIQKTDRATCCAKSFPGQIRGQVLPFLPSPERRKELHMDEGVRSIISRHKRTTYVSETTCIEKWGVALVVASRKTSPYFMAHPIIIRTDQSLKQVFKRLDTLG